MEKPEFSCTTLSKLNLDDIEKVVNEAYHHKDDPGRPPRKRARLERIAIHALLCIIAMLLNALTALRLNRPEKARSITMLAR